MADNAHDAVAEVLKETGFNPNDTSGYSQGGPAEETPVADPPAEETPAPTPEETPAEETPAAEETPVAPAKELKDEDFRASAEELAVIDKNPELKKVYRSLIRGFNGKVQTLSTKMKEAETALQVVETIRTDPARAVRTMAAAAGIKLVEAEPSAPAAGEAAPTVKNLQDKVHESLSGKLGKEAADVLAPVLLDAVRSIVGEETAPLHQTLEEGKKATAEQALRAGIAEFGNSVIDDGGDWDEGIEKDMAGLIGKVLPGKGMTLPEFLEVLHTTVVSKRQKTEQVASQVTRLRKAAATVEPVRPSRPAPTAPSVITPEMDIKEATRLAVAQARKEVGAR